MGRHGTVRVLDLVDREVPPDFESLTGGILPPAELLGRRVGELHVALASIDTPAFAPEAMNALALRSTYQSMRNTAQQTLRALRRGVDRLPASGAADARVRARAHRRSAGPSVRRHARARRPADPRARRPPPRPSAVHRTRLRPPRLRGRTRTSARRAPAEALSVPRCRGHVAFVRLRRQHGDRRSGRAGHGAQRGTSARATRRARRAMGDVGLRRLSPRLLRRDGGTRPASRRPHRVAGSSSTPTCSKRRSTKCATSSTTDPTGSASRFGGSPRCSRDRPRVGIRSPPLHDTAASAGRRARHRTDAPGRGRIVGTRGRRNAPRPVPAPSVRTSLGPKMHSRRSHLAAAPLDSNRGSSP